MLTLDKLTQGVTQGEGGVGGGGWRKIRGTEKNIPPPPPHTHTPAERGLSNLRDFQMIRHIA